MTDNNIKPVRVMHLVSSEGVTGAAQQALFMPMLTRIPKARVKMLVVALSPNVVQGAVLRQNGVPVYDVALSKRRFSLGAFRELAKAVRAFRPDVIQAWGHTAQIVSQWLRNRCEWEAKLVWSVVNTAPLPRRAGMIDRRKLKLAAKYARHADRIVYSSEAAASAHRRVGFPEEEYDVVPLGVDPTRFKPDATARRKIREQLGLEPNAFVIGMIAPFQPEYDHTTLLKAVGELIKTNPNVSVLLAGHGVQRGNAPLMALVGGGTLGTRTQLLGEWSDVAAFFNACDLACSSALTDTARMSLVMAMLCGVPCVATGMGAQGEVIGQFGVAVEPGSPTALIRGIGRVMQMPPDKRMYMAQGARKHALANFVSIRSLQKYLQLYYDLVGRQLAAASSVPAPKIDPTIAAPKPKDKEAPQPAAKPSRTVDMHDLADPDSLESSNAPVPPAPAVPTAPVSAAPKPADGDVLQMFESSLASQAPSARSPMAERARGVAEEQEDLLAPEMLQGGAVATSNQPQAVAPAGEAPKSRIAQTSDTLELTPATAPSPQPTKIIATTPEVPNADAGDELSLAETTLDLSRKIKLEATSTLEIPADLIFVPAETAKPAAASATAVSSAPTPTATPTASVAESPSLSLASEDAPQSVASASPSAASTVSEAEASSSTLPSLAVDALLSAAEASAAPAGPAAPAHPDASPDSGSSPSDVRASGANGCEQAATQDPASDVMQLDLLGDPPCAEDTSSDHKDAQDPPSHLTLVAK